MDQIAVWTILVYALVVVLGGVFGYIKAKSKMSLISGLVSGGALLVAWVLAQTSPTPGIGLAMLIAVVLSVTFILRFARTRKIMPAGLMMVLSLVVTVIFAVDLFSMTN